MRTKDNTRPTRFRDLEGPLVRVTPGAVFDGMVRDTVGVLTSKHPRAHDGIRSGVVRLGQGMNAMLVRVDLDKVEVV